MSEDVVLKKIKTMAHEVCERDGLKLYEVEYNSGSGMVRVYVDAEGGVSLDQCASVSRGMNLLLDVEDPIPGKYNLEVSSPGLERILQQKWHFDAQIGKEIKVVLKARTETVRATGKKLLESKLKETTEEGIIVEGCDTLLPYEDIHKANLVFDYDYNFKNINKKKLNEDIKEETN